VEKFILLLYADISVKESSTSLENTSHAKRKPQPDAVGVLDSVLTNSEIRISAILMLLVAGNVKLKMYFDSL
jgi:hypothetical protein